MQASCPQCSQRIVIDDAKVPDRPFNVKCPKCQAVVKFPGKAAPPPEPEAPSAPPASPASAPAAASVPEEMRAQMMAQLRREMSLGESTPTGRALVAFPDRAQAAAIALVLTRQGYAVDTLDDWDEGGRLLEQGLYAVVVISRAAAAANRETLYQRIGRLGPEARRRIFVVLIGDEFKSGEATQAFAALADLVLHTRDAATSDVLFRNTMAERSRLYQAYLDAQHRHEVAT